MSIDYEEITDSLYIPECVAIQKEVFSLSDNDIYPASFFSLLIRKEHPLGMLVGCFLKEENQRKLIGLVTAISDSKPNSIYCLLIAILPEYQNGRHGLNLLLHFRKFSLEKNISCIYGIYDPLESNLGKLYAHIGLTSYKYITEPYKLNTLEVSNIDKVLFKWDIDSKRVIDKLSNNHTKDQYFDIINKYPIVKDIFTTEEKILIEIPNKYLDLIKSENETAYHWRISTRRLFNEYINNQKYRIIDCISGRIDNKKKTYYILQKSAK